MSGVCARCLSGDHDRCFGGTYDMYYRTSVACQCEACAVAKESTP